MDYPHTHTENVKDTLWGIEVADPYRWLEDDRSEETMAWVNKQIECTQGYLNNLDWRQPLRDRFETPSTVPIWNLPSVIQNLKSAGFSARRHQVWLQAEMARPLFLISLVLLGAAFCMRHIRFGSMGIAILTSVVCGFGLLYLRNFAQVLGESGQLPVAVAVWTPPIAAFLLSLSIILHMEDG